MEKLVTDLLQKDCLAEKHTRLASGWGAVYLVPGSNADRLAQGSLKIHVTRPKLAPAPQPVKDVSMETSEETDAHGLIDNSNVMEIPSRLDDTLRKRLYDHLLMYRSFLQQIIGNVSFTMPVLQEMAWTVPTTQEELITLDRITPQFVSKYGEVFLQRINSFLEENNVKLERPFQSRGLLRRRQQEWLRREWNGRNRLQEASREVMQGEIDVSDATKKQSAARQTNGVRSTKYFKDKQEEEGNKQNVQATLEDTDEDWMKVVEEAERIDAEFMQNCQDELPSEPPIQIPTYNRLSSQYQSPKQPVNPSMNQPVNPSINQPVNQSFSHSVNQPVNPSINQPYNRISSQPQSPNKSFNSSANLSMNQPINQSMNQPVNPSMNQPINQSMNQPVNQSMNQPINQSMNQPFSQSVIQPVNQSLNRLSSQPQSQSPFFHRVSGEKRSAAEAVGRSAETSTPTKRTNQTSISKYFTSQSTSPFKSGSLQEMLSRKVTQSAAGNSDGSSPSPVLIPFSVFNKHSISSFCVNDFRPQNHISPKRSASRCLYA